MQNSHHQNGHVPPTIGISSQGKHSNDHEWLRTPTVAEALAFTPFSSIVPFNPGMWSSNLWLVSTFSHMSACCKWSKPG
jgi:hypothetical protein